MSTTMLPNTQTALMTLYYYGSNVQCSDAIEDFFAPDIQFEHRRVEDGKAIAPTFETERRKVFILFKENVFDCAQNITVRKLSMKVNGWTANVLFEVEYNIREGQDLKRYAFSDQTEITYDPTTWKIKKFICHVEKTPLAPSKEEQVQTYLNVNEFLQSLFRLDAKRFKNQLAPDLKWTFARIIGGFQEGKETVVESAQKVFEAFNRNLFQPTSDFNIRELSITVNGLHAEITCDVTENKKDSTEEPKRYHMSCHEFVTFDSRNQLKAIYERNTRNEVPPDTK